MPHLLKDKLRWHILDEIPPTQLPWKDGEWRRGSSPLPLACLQFTHRHGGKYHAEGYGQVKAGLNMKYVFYKGEEESLYMKIYYSNNIWTHSIILPAEKKCYSSHSCFEENTQK